MTKTKQAESHEMIRIHEAGVSDVLVDLSAHSQVSLCCMCLHQH